MAVELTTPKSNSDDFFATSQDMQKSETGNPACKNPRLHRLSWLGEARSWVLDRWSNQQNLAYSLPALLLIGKTQKRESRSSGTHSLPAKLRNRLAIAKPIITQGTATIVPITPKKLVNVITAIRITSGLKPETLCIILGTSKLFSNC